jgi:hypothetical protein
VAVVTVEEVSGRAAFKRFFEFPYLQFLAEPRWSPPLVSHERARLDPHHRFFDEGDGEYFLARSGGTPAGRVTAHIGAKADEQGWFGFFETVDDPAVTAALMDAASSWLTERGCTSMTGPASFTVADDPGVLVEGFDTPGTTGRPWHPPWYAEHLEAAGLHRVDERRTWRLPALPVDGAGDAGASEAPSRANHARKDSTIAGRLADPRLLLDSVVAVPDLTPARNSAVALARRAKRGDWEGCTIISVSGDPAVQVPRLQSAAAAAGYEWVVAPWSPDPDAPPETVHAHFTRACQSPAAAGSASHSTRSA